MERPARGHAVVHVGECDAKLRQSPSLSVAELSSSDSDAHRPPKQRPPIVLSRVLPQHAYGVSQTQDLEII